MIRIRPYKDSDEAEVLSWCTDEDTCYKWTAGILGDYPITPEQFRWTGDLMRFTALEDTRVAGFFTMRNPRESQDELRFGFVIVDPRLRGKGVGKAMLQLGLEYAFRIYKAKTVSLGVFEDNIRAYRCYRAAGFRETGKKETYSIRGESRTAIDLACYGE